MLTNRYVYSTATLKKLLRQIQQGTAPDKFTIGHLRGLGFKSSNDRAVIPLLKDLGFLKEDGSPTQRYHDFRDPNRAGAVMAEALRQAYGELFLITAKPTGENRKAIVGRFMSAHNVKDKVAQFQAATFFALLEHADLETAGPRREPVVATADPEVTPKGQPHGGRERPGPGIDKLSYTIEVHLPASKDIEVFNAIFRSMREHLL
jgi:uncharacterized protein DUF5343